MIRELGWVRVGDWRETENAVEVGRLCCFRPVRDPYVIVFCFYFFRLLDFFFFGFACLLAVVCCSFASCSISLLPQILSDITFPLVSFLAMHTCNNQPFHRRVLSPHISIIYVI